VDGVRALRQPGSALKPFTYGLALENGYTAATILPDIETRAWTTEGDFIVRNYDETFHGPIRLRTALACSYNVPAVRVLESLGPDLLLSRLHRAGMKSLKKSARFYGLGLTLGNGEVTLAGLTNAYAALARGGLVLPVRFLQDDTNQPQLPSAPASTLFSPQICFILTDILSDPASRAPAFGPSGPLRLPFQCAVKTGTSKDFRDNWTIGYTTKYTVGVWVGNFDGQPMQRVGGVSGAGPLFHDIMIVLHEKEDPPPFPQPPEIIRTEICAASGMLPAADCPSRIDEWFVPGTEPGKRCTLHRAVMIDIRNGLLATARTPKAYREKRVYEQWPPLYESWLVQHNRPLPPQQYSPLSDEDSHQLAIIFPDDGDIFKIDPILRPQYQTLQLQAFVPPGIRKIQWLVDGKVIATVGRPFSCRWKLTKGKHRSRPVKGYWLIMVAIGLYIMSVLLKYPRVFILLLVGLFLEEVDLR
ncbi:MAG TPA: penicillin-binding protein 1C, partial [Anaerolineae bacterium]|nr:penicillin-binding protein 1C [Anaerolineae bacterium]